MKLTVGSVDFDGRDVRRNEHEKESADRVGESEDDERPPERHWSCKNPTSMVLEVGERERVLRFEEEKERCGFRKRRGK